MKLFSGQNRVVLEWLSRRVDFDLAPSTYLLWAADVEGGPILGAMGFGGLMGKSLGSISIALENPQAGRPLMRAAARLFFGGYGIRGAYISIPARRTEWIASLKQVIGFQEVDRIKEGFAPGVDLITFKLTPETCRPWQADLRKMTRMQAREVA